MFPSLRPDHSGLEEAVSQVLDSGQAVRAIVQRWCEAEFSGVAHALTPNCLRLAWVGGVLAPIAEGRISGEQAWIVSADQHGRLLVTEGTYASRSSLVGWRGLTSILAHLVEQAGSPIEIEWLIDNSGIWLVQAQPLLLEDLPAHPSVPEGTLEMMVAV